MLMKLKLLWHVLCGKPLLYRVHFVAGDGVINLPPGIQDIWITECHFDGQPILTEAEQDRVNVMGEAVKQTRAQPQVAIQWHWPMGK
ncbi:MAG: hypothetical protein V4587_03010 [Acidobacteriota bacterium]